MAPSGYCVTIFEGQARCRLEVKEPAVSNFKCPVCGTCVTDSSIQVDTSHWLQSATYLELKQGGFYCVWCEILRLVIEECNIGNTYMKDGVLDWGQDSYRPKWITKGSEIGIELYCMKETERPSGLIQLPIRSETHPRLTIETALQTAQTWLTSCQLAHTACRKLTRVTDLYPTRLLRLGRLHAEHVELVETSALRDSSRAPISVTWTCLSYRWGSQVPQCITKTSNLDEQLQGILWQTLPLTFRDAITFVRKLGYEYIWIDSLCIVQDDIDDWRREASKMGAYYGGAVLTIAATAGEDCNAGLFSHEPLAELHIELQGHIDGHIAARKTLGHGIQAAWKNINLEHLPTLRRGWVLQERLLSRRVLHITKHELQWECRESTLCQCQYVKTNVTDPKISYAQSIGVSANTASWFRAVENFSVLDLTRSDDKFPAISSLAIQFSQRFGQSYVYRAGLWYNSNEDRWRTFVDGLLWAKGRHAVVAGGPLSWRAPSWSWASMEGRVDYPWYHRVSGRGFDFTVAHARYGSKPYFGECFIEISDVEVDLVSEDDPTGQIRGGRLNLSGPLSKATLTYRSRANYTTLRSDDFIVESDAADGSVELFLADYDLSDEEDPSMLVKNDSEVTLLRLCQISNENSILSLVLVPVGDNPKSPYRRIGIAEELSLRGKVYHGDVKTLTIV